jgi:peptidyl-prolyl cis-trans isomerase C
VRLARPFAHAVVLAAALALASPPAVAQGPEPSKVVATVNGKPITEQDLRFAESEVGNDLGSLPVETRRRVLLEYVIENALFADAAEGAKLGAEAAFDVRLRYWRRRALRDAYFDKSVRGAIDDAEARRVYTQQIGNVRPEEEVRARHILVETEALAREIVDGLKKGGDFAELSKKHSKDPGSRENGGDLGYFQRGQMVPQFEEAAFKLAKGDISPPVQSQFGWHIIKLEDKRSKPLPTFEEVKERLVGSLVHRKAQEVAKGLRAAAKVEFLDADIRRQVEAEQAGAKPKQ